MTAQYNILKIDYNNKSWKIDQMAIIMMSIAM